MTAPICPQGQAGEGLPEISEETEGRRVGVVEESEGGECGRKMITERMKQRRKREAENKKSLPSREKRESFTPLPTGTMRVMILTE